MSLRQSKLVPFDAHLIEKLRKDFLMLVKNTSRVQDFETGMRLKEAIGVFNGRFDKLIYQKLLGQKDGGTLNALHRDKKISDGDRDDWDKRLRENSWKFHMELMGFPLIPEVEPPWHTKESRFEDFLAKRSRWLARVQDKARDCWKDFKDFATLVSNQIQSPITMDLPESNLLQIAGFKVLVHTSTNPPMPVLEGLEQLKFVLPKYRERAAAVLPWLLKYQLPFEAASEDCFTQWIGQYDRDHINLCLWSLSVGGSPVRGVIHALAHEMGHHLYRSVLSEEDRKFWDTAISGDAIELDLKELLARWPPSEKSVYGVVEFYQKSDPLFSLQVSVSFSGHNKNRDYDLLTHKAAIEQWVADGKTTVWSTKNPITAYASKNNEEAFCEVLGLLVAYGPRAVLPEVLQRLRQIVPGVRVASSPAARVASQWAAKQGRLSRF